MQAVQLGAQDYLIKGMVDSGGLVRSIRYARERRADRGGAAEGPGRAGDPGARADRRAGPGQTPSCEAEVAERKQAEEALRASQRLLQGIVDNSGAVIYVKDTEGRYLLVNQRFEELFHVTRDEIRGQDRLRHLPQGAGRGLPRQRPAGAGGQRGRCSGRRWSPRTTACTPTSR